MRFNTTFVMFNAKEQTYDSEGLSINYAQNLAIYRKGIGYCHPLRNTLPFYVLSVCSLARTGGNSLSYFCFNSNRKMPKNNGIEAGAKYSNTPFALVHETGNPIQINPPLHPGLTWSKTLAD